MPTFLDRRRIEVSVIPEGWVGQGRDGRLQVNWVGGDTTNRLLHHSPLMEATSKRTQSVCMVHT